MNSTEQITFQRALADVTQLQNVSTEYLENMLQQYPWFATAHQLLAKKYQMMQHPNFDAQLQMAALHSLNRNELFELIENTSIAEVVKPEVQPKAATTIEMELVENVVKQPEITALELSEFKFDFLKTADVEIASAPTKAIDLSSLHMEDKVQEEPIAEPAKPEMDESIIENVQTETTIEEEIIPEPIIQKQIAAIEPKVETVKAEPAKIIMEENKPTEAKQEKEQSFVGWLKQFSKGSTIHQSHEVQQKKQETIQKAKSIMNEFAGNPNDDEEDNEIDDLKVDLVQLTSFGMQQHEEFVTETMAKIYVQQEKYDRAISIYEKLSLLKPEKSVFFAAQISELKNKIQ